MKKIALMPREAAFWDRARKAYHHMRERVKEKRTKKNRIIQVGRQIPFTLDQFNDWLVSQFHGDPNGVIKCRYCTRMITGMDFQVEHVEPLKQGGSLDLENLALVDEECNRFKGNLTESAFAMLKEFLRRLQDEQLLADAAEIEQRMKISGSAHSMRKRLMILTAKPKPAQAPAMEYQHELEDF
jgi:hypothetical protein